MSFFDLGSRRASTNESLKEGVDYKLIPADNKNSQHMLRIFNFENPQLCPREGLVEFVPTKRSRRGENWLNFSHCYDAKNDIYIGIPAGYDERTGKLKFQRIIIKEDELLNRANPQEAMKAAVLCNSYYVEGSPLQKPKPKYKIYDKEKEATGYAIEVKTRRRAQTVADGLSGSNLVEMAINLGLPTEAMSPAVLFMEVGKIAEKDWKKFIEIYDNPDRKLYTVINRGLATGVLTEELGLGICYGKIPLGINKPLAVAALKENEGLCQTIDQLSRKQEKDSWKAMASVTKPEPNFADDKDVLIARQQAMLDEMKAKMDEMSKTKLEDFTKHRSEELAEADPEFAEMLKEAKALGVKGAHLCSKETLAQKIAEARPKSN